MGRLKKQKYEVSGTYGVNGYLHLKLELEATSAMDAAHTAEALFSSLSHFQIASVAPSKSRWWLY